MKVNTYCSLAFICFVWIGIVTSQSCSHEDDSRCFDETCATPLSTITNDGSSCECVDDDIGVKFSDCDPTGTTRSLVYFWKPPATCLGGTLPAPITGVPCALTCSEGTYLNVSDNFSCRSCPAGTFSVGGGKKWTDWNYLPAQFNTYCAATNNQKYCRPWRLNGDNIDSGNNYGYDNLESNLELRVKLVRNGTIRFQYKVSAEQNYDGLQFFVDGVRAFFKYNTDWVPYNQTVAAGYHTFLWKYYKDRSITVGEDKATIKMIHVDGTTYAVTECEECDLGFYNPTTGASECLACPSGNFSDITGATSCQKCPAGTYSFPGSYKCYPARTCNNATNSPDVTWNQTNCVDGVRTVSYQWIQPMTCSGSGNLTLPPSYNVTCTPGDPCPAGTYRDASTAGCRYCELGTASDGTTQCADCPAGQSASSRIAYFTKWQYPSWPQGTGTFSTSCAGSDCLTSGWRFGEWFTDSGSGHGQDAKSTLSLAINAYSGAMVYFNYSLQCHSDDSVLLSVDDVLVTELQCTNSTCNAPWTVTSFVLKDYDNDEIADVVNNTISSQLHPYAFPANRTFNVQWSYVKRSDATNNSCDRILISGIKIDGVAVGNAGAGSCQPCKAGSSAQAKSSECTLCVPGTTSSADRTKCEACTGNTFADFDGTPQCAACGAPTVSSNSASSCEYNCSVVILTNSAANTSRTYNFSPIKDFNITYLDSPEGGNTTEYKFSGSLCGWSSQCGYPSQGGGSIHAYVCQNTAGLLTNLGKVAAFKEINYTTGNNVTAPGILFDFSQGDIKANQTCRTSLTLYCDPSSSVVAPSVSSMSLNTSCNLNLTWTSKYACPVCTANDYGVAYGNCNGGSQTVTYYQVNSFCYGGYPLPVPTSQDCEEKVTVKKTALIVVTVLGSIALAAALAGLAALYYRHRKLYASYSQLRMNVPLDEDNTDEPQFKSLDDE
eukprot:CAMPEP_0168563142 /NCGR_PEP_ID=MMETSP0413-20121227/12519_1 /TAXON_ID=136452 /ORGANISM="Filamoeba nolandi, Strain NC-AS-23-1" /LENGTH=942 /DNA_ID=CAMNT_0008594657 /DNA_START=76 /DNA_END=2904 /DNA_ORIENTATION=+